MTTQTTGAAELPEALRPEMLDDLIATFESAGRGNYNLMRVELPRHQWTQLAEALRAQPAGAQVPEAVLQAIRAAGMHLIRGMNDVYSLIPAMNATAQPAGAATPAAPAPGVPSGIYVASRASVPERPARWRALRDAGWPIVSTWIDEAGPGETADLGELWARITREVASAQGVLLHVEPDDFPLKGALIEVGMALSLGKRVGVYVPGVELEELSMRPLGSWAAHPLVYVAPTLQSARWWVEEAPQPPAAVMADCSGGSPCSTCPDKKKCSRGCVRQGGQA